MSYPSFFRSVTGHDPFPYQDGLAAEPWPELLDVPTGLGKTAAVTVAWLFKRLQDDPATGRRLIHCLPMRSLVEQTAAAAASWCERAEPRFSDRGLRPPRVHVLMGGNVDQEWEQSPEQSAILVGTQDMLLSRALNRGYAMSRYKWPIHFALLNNDCLWVLDEPQLIGVGVETSTQLQGLRRKLGAVGPTHTIWMSATLDAGQLDTIDHRPPEGGRNRRALGQADRSLPMVHARTGAAKVISRTEGVQLDAASAPQYYVEHLAARVQEEHHKRGGLTLAIMNRVSRAQALYEALTGAAESDSPVVALVHSRFRSTERRRAEEVLLRDQSDRIVVATQAVEAGMDVSATTLITELAPWPSLVQRFGRCNRFGDGEGTILWTDIDTDEAKGTLALPYEAGDLAVARELLERLAGQGGASPDELASIQFDPPSVVRPVIRRRDLLDLFDTTVDLSGNDIDVSRYVRDGEDTDVHFYWRHFDGEPSVELSEPGREELCRVSLVSARDFISKLGKVSAKLRSGSEKAASRAGHMCAWRFDPLERTWEVVRRVVPGQMLLLHPEAGGYDNRLGWTGDVSLEVAPGEIPAESTAENAYGSDPSSSFEGGRWVLLRDHLDHVRTEARALARSLMLGEFEPVLETAALWHDVGKAHEAFQAKLLAPLEDRPELRPEGSGPWAKSSHRLRAPETRNHFRHELASALAWLGSDEAVDRRFGDLVAYLVASHHGKVRLSLRSLPGETVPGEPDRLIARGIWDGDELPPLDLPDGGRLEARRLDLSVMVMGPGSWIGRVLELRNALDLGPFRLTMLETAIRVADWRASHQEQAGYYDE